jgi:Putative Ig domain
MEVTVSNTAIARKSSASMMVRAGLLCLAASSLLQATTMVTLNPAAVPATADLLVTNVNVIGHGFPSGTIPPANVTVSLNPTTPGGGPSGTTAAVAVKVISGATEAVTFRVPKSILVAAPTSYQVSIAGSTSGGSTFQSSNSASLTVNPPLRILTASPLPTGTVGINYSQTLTAKGGSGVYTWAVANGSLPAGLSLNSTTGEISGIPTSPGVSNFYIKVTDSLKGVTAKAFALTIDPPLSITTQSLPNGTVGDNYSQTLMATGGSGQYTWSVIGGALPGGLTLTPATGVISGQPNMAGTFNFTIQVTDTVGATATQPLAITVVTPVIQTVAPNSANAGLTLQVALTGLNTNFVQGVSVATFGPDVSVGGAPAGQPGPVTVTSATTATAALSISPTAATGAQTVTVTTGGEVASLAGGFTINAAIPFITVNTTLPASIATNFSGFADEYLLTGVEYNDPKYLSVVQALKPGFIRYPSGLPSMAFDWQSAHENQTWINNLTPYISSIALAGLNRGLKLAQAKGGACFTPGACYSDFSSFLSSLGANGIVDFNGFSDTNADSMGLMAAAAQAANANIVEWELANEPYFYPLYFASPAAYASFEYSPYFLDLQAAAPAATAGVFFQGQFSSAGGNYMTWDNGMAAYTPKYWNGVSTHVYPITSSHLSTSAEEQTLNGVLAHGTTDYISSYLAPLVGGSPIFITEMNSDAFATLPFESYLYNGIFLAEYVARMSTSPYVKAVGVQSLYLGNTYNQGIIRAVNDFENYLIAQVNNNPNYSTNTATNPSTQFQFYFSTNALCLAVANLAINNSNAIWPTVMNGGPTVPILGYDGQPIPAVFAQGYQGTNGTHYLLITNKSSQSVPVAIEVNGTLLEQTVTVSYVSNPSDTAQNTATNQNNVQIVTTPSPNPITVGPYSVTRVEW